MAIQPPYQLSVLIDPIVNPAITSTDPQLNLENAALLQTAMSQAASGNYGQAVETLNGLSPENNAHTYYTGILEKAKYLFYLNQIDDSLHVLSLIPEDHSAFPNAQQMIGNILLKRQEWRQALVHFNRVPLHHDIFIDTQVTIVRCYCELGQFSDASECIDSVPDQYPYIDYFRLEAVQVSSEYDAMLRHSADILNKITNEFDDYLDVQALKGEILYKLKDCEKAMECLIIIPPGHHDFDKTQIVLSNIYSQNLNETTQAIRCLNRISNESDHFLDSQRALFNLYRLDNQIFMAVRALDNCITAYRESGSFNDLEICYISQLNLLEETGHNECEKACEIRINLSKLYFSVINPNPLLRFTNLIKQHCMLIPKDNKHYESAQFFIELCLFYTSERTSFNAHLRQINVSLPLYYSSPGEIIQSRNLLLERPLKNKPPSESLSLLENAAILTSMKRRQEHSDDDECKSPKRARR